MYQYLRPFVVGVVHGLAGSAAVALLVLTTIRNVRWAIAYLLVFGVGTITGMMLITMSIASAFTWWGRGVRSSLVDWHWLQAHLVLASAFSSLIRSAL